MEFVAYMFRESRGQVRSIDVLDNIVLRIGVCSAFFCSLCYFIPKFIQWNYPVFYKSLSDKKRNEIPTYISCVAHHCVVVPVGMYGIYRDMMRTPEETLNHNYAESESFILVYCFGYLVGDMVFFAVGEALRGKYDIFLHHVFSMALIYIILYSPGPTNRYIPHVIICEFSQLFFIAAWFLRLIESKRDTLIACLEITFAIAYFLVRIVNLPIAAWRILDEAGPYLNPCRAVLWPIVSLQFFWMSKIVQNILEKTGIIAPKASKKKTGQPVEPKKLD